MARQGIRAIHIGVILLATPEVAATSRSVTVSRGGTESLLALVVAGECDLEHDGDEEQETKAVALVN